MPQLTKEEMLELYNEVATVYNAKEPRWPLSVSKPDWYGFFELADNSRNGVEGFTLVDSYGGESMGEYAMSVVRWKGTLYKAEYAYYSHEGTDYSYMTIKKVQPVEKTVTVYE